MDTSVILAPSLLAGDHARLGESAQAVENSGLKWLHIDIMDGHFVPNLTFGPDTVKALRKDSGLFFDVHLMLDNPHRHVEAFIKGGADLVSIHVEPEYPLRETLQKIRAMGRKNGIVLNPGTPADAALPWLDAVDLVLLMTVQPGFGGQSFKKEVLPKISSIHRWREERDLSFRIEVDGGIDEDTALLCRQAGADTFVAGTAYYKAADREAFIRSFTTME